MKKASLADIAKELGVSKTLVSMVLNDQGDLHGINIDTQKRVKEKAKELNYKPNRVARGLRTGQTYTLGLIVTDISNPFYSKIARSIENFAYNAGYHLIFASSNENPKREEELIEMMLDRQVDGLILATTLTNTNKQPIERVLNQKTPLVLIDRYIEDINFDLDTVIGDNEKGAFSLTEHLISKQCKKIALFTITPNHLSSIRDRIKGYKAAVNQHGNVEEIIIDIPYEDVVNSVNKSLDNIIKNNLADGIITLNNTLASACVNYFKSNNISLPNDIKFASYDDVEWFKYANPSITGVAQPLSEIGEKSIEILLKKISAKNTEIETEHISLSAVLIERDSSK